MKPRAEGEAMNRSIDFHIFASLGDALEKVEDLRRIIAKHLATQRALVDMLTGTLRPIAKGEESDPRVAASVALNEADRVVPRPIADAIHDLLLERGWTREPVDPRTRGAFDGEQHEFAHPKSRKLFTFYDAIREQGDLEAFEARMFGRSR